MQFRSRALKRFWERNDARRLPPDMLERISDLLDDLDASRSPRDMDQPGLRFHQLVGNRRGTRRVRVSANWRLTFRFEDNEAVDVNLEDYH